MTDSSSLLPWQKVFPNQAFNRDLYRRTDVPFERAVYDLILETCDLQHPHTRFELEQTSLHSVDEMASSPVTLALMQWILSVLGARRVLEIGTFIGVSALYFAEAIADDGKVVTIEKFDQFADIARRNFVRNRLDHKIELRCGDAIDILGQLDGNAEFDLVFIDGNKERYATYLQMTEPLTRPGGVIVLDDAFFHGDALNEQFESEKGAGVHQALVHAGRLKSWRKTLLPIANGMLLLTKPRGPAGIGG